MKTELLDRLVFLQYPLFIHTLMLFTVKFRIISIQHFSRKKRINISNVYSRNVNV
jgi:hypothetical protein